MNSGPKLVLSERVNRIFKEYDIFDKSYLIVKHTTIYSISAIFGNFNTSINKL